MLNFKTIQSVIICLILFISEGSGASETLIINDVDWPPYFISEETAQLKGIGKELLELCLTEAGYQFKFTILPIKRTHNYMKTGKIDLCVYSYKKEREKYLHYSKEPLFSSQYRFLVKSDSDIRIQSLKDLNTLIFGHLNGLTYTPELLQIIEEKEKKGTVSHSNSLESLILQLTANPKRFDITANSMETFLWKAKQMNVLDKVKVLDFDIKTKNYYITISQKSKSIHDKKNFMEQIDKRIRQMKSDGRYSEILLKYGIQ